jgi:hypothetical protein
VVQAVSPEFKPQSHQKKKKKEKKNFLNVMWTGMMTERGLFQIGVVFTGGKRPGKHRPLICCRKTDLMW